jgi:TonB family protein
MILPEGWVLDGPGLTPGAEALRVVGARGSARSKPVFLDFELKLHFRLIDANAEAVLLLRSDDPGRNALAATGYRLVVFREDPLIKVSLEGLTQPVQTERARDATSAPFKADGWHQLRVRCYGDQLTTWINGVETLRAAGGEPLAGRVALEARRGTVEYRHVGVQPLDYDPAHAPVVPLRLEGTDTLPYTVHEVRPEYTVEARRRDVAGTVWVEATVLADGTVGRTRITKPLDPDLDVMARAAARRWRFRPGTANGVAVPVIVTIELTFKLE